MLSDFRGRGGRGTEWDRDGRVLVCKGLLCLCFFVVVVFVSLRSLLDALKSEYGVINRNVKLLESFIILFEACSASLCNLQHFFLLSGIFG